MFSKNLLLVIIAILTINLAGCTSTPKKLNYQLDPEINNIERLSEFAKLLSVNVTQSKTLSEQDDSNINSPKDKAGVLKEKLMAQLKNYDFKFINNPLLADLGIDIHINQLKTNIKQSLLKSSIKVNSEIKVKFNKQSQSISKSYVMSRVQEVANPLKDIDVTGTVNQLLTKQLSDIFNDPEVYNFIQKTEESLNQEAQF